MSTKKDETTIDIEPENCPRIVDVAQAEAIVKKSALIALGVGVIPIPLFDFAALTATALDLTRRLSKLYGVEFKEGAARKIIVSVLGAAAPTAVSGPVASLMAGIPLVGLPLAVATRPALSAMCIYGVGSMFITHFQRGGSFINANAAQMKEDFSEAYKNSREWLGNTISGTKVKEAKEAR